MTVDVRLFATLAERGAGSGAGISRPTVVPVGTTLRTLIAQLGIDPRQVHLTIVNGRIVHDLDARLSDGDRVGLFPPVGGG